MAEFSCQFPLKFFAKKPLEVKLSRLDLSSDAGLLLVRQAEEQLKICAGLADCLADNREPGKVKHPLTQLISQRVYQIAAGYEDTNDSNYLRHDPIFKIACDKVPIPGEELLASQPTMSRERESGNKPRNKSDAELFSRPIPPKLFRTTRRDITGYRRLGCSDSRKSAIKFVSRLLMIFTSKEEPVRSIALKN